MAVSVAQTPKVTAIIVAGNLASFLGATTLIMWVVYMSQLKRQYSDRPHVVALSLVILHGQNFFYFGVIFLAAMICIGLAQLCHTESPDTVAWTITMGAIVALLFYSKLVFEKNRASRNNTADSGE